MSQYDIAVTMVTQSCYSCKIIFAATKDFDDQRRQDHQSFYCPAGHPQIYAAKSKEELARDETLQVQAKLNEANHARLVAEKAKEDAEKRIKQIEKRVASGICPCCNRTFKDLAQHMSGKHAEFCISAGKKRRQIAAA